LDIGETAVGIAPDLCDRPGGSSAGKERSQFACRFTDLKLLRG
jgi:hypothetical protein